MCINVNKTRLININFKLSKIEIKAIEEQKMHYQDSRAVSIEALKIVQKIRGWVSDDSIYAISEILNIPAHDVEEVATFYSNIYRKPVGRHIIKYCDSMVCYITGYMEIKLMLETLLAIEPGKTTIDNRFTLLPTCCLGCCDQSPVMMIDDDTYFNLKKEQIPYLLEKYK
ncbi:NADH-quinone oxidoreductase subunit E [Buchnera aphidicola (Eriosoma lanigerum)]|uniref:NADH-quinone oxidoreductase subunit NuoE n=1 Tax=Buchnera aphidicola TaxID=9 RepID=UPI0034646194